MLDNFDSFFPKKRPLLKKVPGSPDAMQLLDEQILEEMLNQLEASSAEAGYPLQISFYEKLMQCDLLLPVPAGTRMGMEMPVIMLENGRGEKGLPLFTSENNMALWLEGEPTDYVFMPFVALCGYAISAQADYIVVNAAGPYGCEISLHDFSYLAEGLLPPPLATGSEAGGRKAGEVMIEKNTPMRLGQSAGLPDMLMERLNHVFEYNRQIIEQVYLFDIAFNNGPLQPALAVRMPDDCEAKWETELWPTLQAILHEMMERRAILNVFLLNQSGRLESHVKELTNPIFTGKPAS